jgi:peptidoglycan/LPS O-acetylase OafA/YrhL
LFRKDIQQLRALAVLAVLFFHFHNLVRNGYLGVDIFFVISGFVITKNLFAHPDQVFSFKKFYQRRIYRLLPALSTMLFISSITLTILISVNNYIRQDFWVALSAIFGFSNFTITKFNSEYFAPNSNTLPFLHTWSLSAEEQFYLVVAICLLVIGKKSWQISKIRFQIFITSFILISLSIFLLSIHQFTFSNSNQFFGYYSSLARFWEFGSGALLFFACEKYGKNYHQNYYRLSLVLLFSLLFWTPFSNNQPSTLLGCALTALVIFLGQNTKLISAPLVFIGDLSYSLYLWHLPVIALFNLLKLTSWVWQIFALILILALSLLSYYVVEKPIRGMGKLKLNQKQIATISAFLLIPTLSLLAMPTIANAIPSTGLTQLVKDSDQIHLAYTHNCHEGSLNYQYPASNCLWNNQIPTNTPIYLFGDSNAAHFSESVIKWGAEVKAPTHIFTGSSCYPAPGLIFHARGVDPNLRSELLTDSDFAWCQNYYQNLLAYLNTAKPGLVILSGLDQYFWDTHFGINLPNQPTVWNQTQKLKLLNTALDTFLTELKLHKFKVILLDTIPNLLKVDPNWNISECNRIQYLIGNCKNRSFPESAELAQQTGYRAVLANLALKFSVPVIKVDSYFCQKGNCYYLRAGRNLYRDTSHMTVFASTQIGNQFSSAFANIYHQDYSN